MRAERYIKGRQPQTYRMSGRAERELESIRQEINRSWELEDSGAHERAAARFVKFALGEYSRHARQFADCEPEVSTPTTSR